MKNEKNITLGLLTISIITFFAFGFFHLAKFETTDEHLWKYDRIKQYWQAIGDRNWEKTYINDKPGVSVAIISGIGLLFEKNPENNNTISDPKTNLGGLFDVYQTNQSERINMLFRLPILIFSSLSLLAFFWLSRKAFGNSWLSLLTTILIAFNPILLGISQVINPDSFFWIFGGLSALSYFALINNRTKKMLFLCGILTGLALLSKYTSFMLFLFFVLSSFSKIIFQNNQDSNKTDWKTLWQHARDIAYIFLISIATFSIILPAVLVKPEYLFKGISQFLNLKSLLALTVLMISLSLLMSLKKNIIGKIVTFFSTKKHYFLGTICGIFSLLLLLSIANVWTGQKLIPVDALRDAAYANEPKEFNFKPLLDKKTNTIQKNSQLFLMEAYPFIFSLTPLAIILFFWLTIKSFAKKITDQSAAIIFPIISFTLLYFVSTIFAGIVTNVRYSIILYPLFAILSAVIIIELAPCFRISKKIFFASFAIVIIFFGIIRLFNLKPFYFSYANFLLPKEFSIHDSWGHGSYEAAQHLNSLPNAKDLIIWSNSDTVCRFFTGKCLRSRKIDLSIAKPDYFVISKRGELKISNRFILNNNPEPKKDSGYYFAKLKSDYSWQILIDNRPDNFIKIIKFEKQ